MYYRFLLYKSVLGAVNGSIQYIGPSLGKRDGIHILNYSVDKIQVLILHLALNRAFLIKRAPVVGK